jgi:hypothetical protein
MDGNTLMRKAPAASVLLASVWSWPVAVSWDPIPSAASFGAGLALHHIAIVPVLQNPRHDFDCAKKVF